MEVSRTTWTILAVFTLGAYFFAIVTNQVAKDPPQNQIPGVPDDPNSTLPELSHPDKVAEVFANSLDAPDWTNAIWRVIYAWQAFIIIYAFTLLCRRSGAEDEEYLYCSPQFWNPWFFVCYIFSFLFNIGYIVSYGLTRDEFSLLFILLTSIALGLALLFSFINLSRTQADLLKRGFFRDVVFNIGVVQNGVGFYLTYVIATCYQAFNIVLIREADLSDFTATTISYSILLVELIVWFALDNFLWQKVCRYFFAPYIVLIWYLLGVLIMHWDDAFANSIYGLVVLCLSLVALITKTVLVINRSRDEPMLSEGYQRI